MSEVFEAVQSDAHRLPCFDNCESLLWVCTADSDLYSHTHIHTRTHTRSRLPRSMSARPSSASTQQRAPPPMESFPESGNIHRLVWLCEAFSQSLACVSLSLNVEHEPARMTCTNDTHTNIITNAHNKHRLTLFCRGSTTSLNSLMAQTPSSNTSLSSLGSSVGGKPGPASKGGKPAFARPTSATPR